MSDEDHEGPIDSGAAVRDGGQTPEESRTHFQTIIDAIPEAMMVIDRSHRIVLANRTARDLAGGKDPVSGGMTCYQLSHARETPCTGEDEPCPLEKAVRTGKPVMVTHKHYDAFDREFFVDVSAAPIKDENGEVVQVIEAHRDITDRKCAEEMLQRERDFVSAVLDTANALVVVVDTAGRIVRFNRACERISGYTFEEVAGKEFWQFLLVPEEVEAAVEAFEKLRAGNFPSEFENHWVAKDGSRRWIAWSNTSLVDETGAVEYIIGTGMDMTENRQVQVYQALSAQLLERLNRPDREVDVLPDLVSLIKDATGFEAVGIRLRENGSFPCMAFSGTPDFFHLADCFFNGKGAGDVRTASGEGSPSARCRCAGVLNGAFDSRNPAISKGGSFWVNSAREFLAGDGDGHRPPCADRFRDATPFESAALIPVRADEDIIGLLQLNDSRPKRFTAVKLGFLEQIGASIGMAIKRRRAEEALKVLNQNLEHRVAERTAMLEERAVQLGRLAADLTQTEQRERRRLAHLLHDHLQQLLVGAKMSVGFLQQRGSKDADRIQTLQQIEDMLDQAIESSRTLSVELSPPILYDGGLVQALDWLATWMKDKYGLTVELEADHAADPVQEEVRVLLFQAVRELLFNVVKHSGTDRAHVWMTKHDDELVKVVVADLGVGFEPPDCRERQTSPSGFGLLSICERIECLGGKMAADSAPGKGTRITLIAPVDRRPVWVEPQDGNDKKDVSAKRT